MDARKRNLESVKVQEFRVWGLGCKGFQDDQGSRVRGCEGEGARVRGCEGARGAGGVSDMVFDRIVDDEARTMSFFPSLSATLILSA